MAIKLPTRLQVFQKKTSKELPPHEANNEISKERYIYPLERQQIIDELRLI